MADATLVGRERRLEDRYDVDLPVTLRGYRLGPFDARMVDISSGGAMVAMAGGTIPRGDEILLAAHGLELVATVAWTTEAFCGLAFHRTLHTAEVTTIRKAGRARPAH